MDFSRPDDKVIDQLVSNILSSSHLRDKLKELISLGFTSVKTAYKGTGSYLEANMDDDDTGNIYMSPKPSTINVRDRLSAQLLNDEVVLVLDYTERSHALFLNKRDYPNKALIDELAKTKWLSDNSRLAFGEGWVVINKSKIPELENMLTRYKANYRKVSRQRFELECKGVTTDLPSSQDAEYHDKISDKVSGDKHHDKIISDKVIDKDDDSVAEENDLDAWDTLLSLNKWKNTWNEETRLVFEKKNNDWIVIGKQDRKSRVKGSTSILPLTDDDRKVCTERNWSYTASA